MGGLFVFDLLVPTLIVLPFVAVPVVVSAVWAPTRVVVGLAILSVTMALVSGISNDYFANLNDILWMGAMALIGAVAVAAAEIRERTQAQRDAASSMLRATLDAEFDPHVFLEAVRDHVGQIVDFVYVDANPAACAYIQIPREQLIGARLLELLPGHVGSGLLESYREVVETGQPLHLDDFAYEQELLGGEPRRYDVRATKVGDAISYTWRDVTDRYETARAMQQSEERYRLLAENSSDVVVRSREGTILWVSPSLARCLGWQPREWIGHSLQDFTTPDDAATINLAQADMQSGNPVIFKARAIDSSGNWHWVEVHAQAYRDAQGRVDGYLSSFRVIDKEVEAEADLAKRAAYDDLTGALKRDLALQRLEDIGQHPRVPGTETAVLFIDVDDFKNVNDTFGHAVGDALLQRFAEIMRESVRAGDTIARMGGDEFLIILPGLHSLDEATCVAEKIHAACAQPIPLRGEVVTATVSIGVTLSRTSERGEDMVARADHAMYAAKSAGRNAVVAIPAQMVSPR